MVYLPVSHVTRRPARRPSRLLRFVSAGAEFLQMLGAAIRVAGALEVRREPHPEDLKTLGIRGKLPRLF